MTQYMHDPVRATMMEDAPSTMHANKKETGLRSQGKANQGHQIFLDVYVHCMSTYAHVTSTGAAGSKPIHMSHR
jgi:hypothetical protein